MDSTAYNRITPVKMVQQYVYPYRHSGHKKLSFLFFWIFTSIRQCDTDFYLFIYSGIFYTLDKRCCDFYMGQFHLENIPGTVKDLSILDNTCKILHTRKQHLHSDRYPNLCFYDHDFSIFLLSDVLQDSAHPGNV